MKPKTNLKKQLLIFAGILLCPGLSLAAIAPVPTITSTPNLIPNISSTITPPYIGCTGKINAQTVEADGTNMFSVTWTVTSASTDGNAYRLYYKGNTGIITQNLESTNTSPLANPYKINVTYPLKTAEASPKTVSLTAKLLDYATSVIEKEATCQLSLARKETLSTPPQQTLTNVVFSGLTATPDPFVPDGGNYLKVGYTLSTGGQYMYVNFQIVNSTATSTYYAKTSKINFDGTNFFLWNGKDSSSNLVAPGTYKIIAKVSDSDPLNTPNATIFKTLTKTITVNAPAAPASADDSTSGNSTSSESSSGSGSGTSSGSGSSGSTTTSGSGTESGSAGSGSTNTSSSGSGGSSSNSGSQAEVQLKASPVELKCSPEAKVLYFKDGEPAYDRMFVNCVINMPAKVKAGIYNKSYDPKSADNSGNLIREILVETPKKKSAFKLGWDGYDDFDRPVALEEYTFVVEARIDNTYKPKISIKNFKIENVPGSETAVTGTEAAADNTATADNLHGAAADTAKPGLLQQVNEAIFGTPPATDTSKDQTADKTVQAEEKPVQKTPSKCPNSFYPLDISGSPYEALIKKAYDECVVTGYADSTFRMDKFATRAEALKMVMLAAGQPAKQGCYDADCGSPFQDLEMWQGPWVRAAWDLKMVNGIAPGRFGGNEFITRAETAVMLAKAFKVNPFPGCYTANCGAGYPNNFFNDVTQSWQGPYLRALWDKGVLQTLTPGRFYPDSPINRVQFLDMLYQVKSLKK